FWRTNVTAPHPRCAAAMQGREQCPLFEPCEPAESCLGNNTCAQGYDGARCMFCARGFYRVSGECVKCSDSPWAVVIVFGLGAIAALAVAYTLNKKNINLALISIGIDYFQVLAMF